MTLFMVLFPPCRPNLHAGLMFPEPDSFLRKARYQCRDVANRETLGAEGDLRLYRDPGPSCRTSGRASGPVSGGPTPPGFGPTSQAPAYVAPCRHGKSNNANKDDHCQNFQPSSGKVRCSPRRTKYFPPEAASRSPISSRKTRRRIGAAYRA